MSKAKAKKKAKTYAPTKQRKVTDAVTGESNSITVPKRIKEWWFVTDTGKLSVQLRYGAKIVSLGNKVRISVDGEHPFRFNVNTDFG